MANLTILAEASQGWFKRVGLFPGIYAGITLSGINAGEQKACSSILFLAPAAAPKKQYHLWVK
jgi:hypothetical protein